MLLGPKCSGDGLLVLKKSFSFPGSRDLGLEIDDMTIWHAYALIAARLGIRDL